MAVSDNYAPTKTIGDGATVEFTATWNVIAASYIRVYLENVSTGVQVLQTKDTDYTLTFDSSGLTVDFTIGTTPPATEYVVIARVITQDQDVPYKTSQGFQGSVIENSLDKIVSIAQDQQDDLDRALKYALASGKSGTMPTPVDDTVLCFDGTSGALKTGATNTSLVAGATDAAASAVTATTQAGIATTQAGIATTKASEASDSADAAAASAAGVNLPDINAGDATKIIKVNSGETGFEFAGKLPDFTASKRGAILVQNAADDGFEFLNTQGTSGQVLQSNGADALPSFGTLTTGSMVLLSTQTASNSANIDFVDGTAGVVLDSTYNGYIFQFWGLVPATDDTSLYVTVSDDTGSTFESSGYAITLAGVTSAGSAANSGNASTSRLEIGGNGVANEADRGITGAITVFGLSDTNNDKRFLIQSAYEKADGVFYAENGAGHFFGNNSALNGIRFAMAAGNITSGTIRLYGII